MSSSSAEFKGSLFPLSVLQLEDADLGKLQNQLQNKLAQSRAFFFRAPVVINIEKVSDDSIDFGRLKQVIEDSDFVCVGICNGTSAQKKQARVAGLASLTQPKHQQAPAEKEQPIAAEPTTTEPMAAKTTKIVRQNIRSGQQIYAKNSDLVIIGSVGNGSEVIADGDIHVYGTLRGRAIAGASGNKNSAIFSQSIEAELVSIAGTYWLSESLQSVAWKKSAIVKLQQEQLVVEPLLSIQN